MCHHSFASGSNIILMLQSLLFGNSLLCEVLLMDYDRDEKVTFYSSPAVVPEVHPGSEEGLSGGPHKQSCAAVPSTATWARDTGIVCGSSQPTQQGAAPETPELVHLMALCAVLVRGFGHTSVAPCLGSQPTLRAWSCRDPAVQLAWAASMPCRDHKAPAWPKGPAQGPPEGLQWSKGPSSV